MSRAIKCAFVALLAVAIPAAVLGQSKDEESRRAARAPGFQGMPRFGPVGGAVRAPGTITYDTGTFSALPTIPAIADNFTFANQFNTANGGALPTPITITGVSMFMAVVNSGTVAAGNVFVTLFSPVAGTNAAPITSPLLALTPGTFNNITAFNGQNPPASFLLGQWNPTAGSGGGPTTCGNDCVGMDTNTTGGQGFHGWRGEDLNGGNWAAIGNQNALIRVSVANIPVELMDFEVE
ncbi:MAG: hypothetical protein R2991_02840 [Thermoanaerobaculia bacterium]